MPRVSLQNPKSKNGKNWSAVSVVETIRQKQPSFRGLLPRTVPLRRNVDTIVAEAAEAHDDHDHDDDGISAVAAAAAGPLYAASDDDDEPPARCKNTSRSRSKTTSRRSSS